MIYIDKKYVLQASVYLKRFKEVNTNVYNFRCPICGDSKKNDIKARGYFFQEGNNILFKCWNCGVSKNLYNFLMEISPQLASEYKFELLKEKGNYKHSIKKIDDKVTEKIKEITSTVDISYKTILDAPFVKNLPTKHPCYQYLKSRKIPEKFFGYLQYTDNFKELVTKTIQNSLHYPSDKRLVIPVYNSNFELTHIQGRALEKDSKIRYTTVTVKDEPKIFGLDRLKHNKKKYVVEGPLDSLFIPNTIATMDSCLHKGGMIDKDFILIHDCQPRNKEIVKQMKSSIDRGYSVVIFPNMNKGKDINEMILNGIQQDEILDIIEKNTFSGLKAKIMFDRWKKI